jgi:transcriptional regulator with XRE-family HTH domain
MDRLERERKNRKEFGHRFKDALTAAGYTQRQAALKLDIPESRMSEYCRGARVPYLHFLSEMVEVLGLEPWRIIPHWFRSVSQHRETPSPPNPERRHGREMAGV